MAKSKKKIKAIVKMQIPAGEATPGPPVGVALGPHGVAPSEFVQRFNSATADQKGTLVSVVINIYQDRSTSFIVKSPPASFLLKQAASIAKGSSVPHKEKVGTVTRDQVRAIAERKKEDLNADSTEQAMKMIEGSARSMGIVVEG